MNLKKNVGTGKQTIFIIFGKLLALVSTLIIPLVLTRSLTQAEYGIYSQFQTLTLFISSIFSLSIQTNLFYFLPNETPEKKRILILQTFLLLIILAFVATILTLIPFFSNILMGNSEIVNYTSYIAIAIFLMMPPLILESLYVIQKDIKTSLLFPPITSLLKILLVLIVIFSSLTNSIENIILAVIISLLFPFIFTIIYVLKNVKSKNTKRIFNLPYLIQQLKYSLPFGSAVIISTIIRRIDKIICITYLTTTEYAVYSIAFIGIPGIQQIYDAVSQVIIVKIVEAVKEGAQSKILNLYKLLISKTLSYTIPLILIVILFTKDIITILFTADYIKATPFFQLYLITFIIGMLGAGIILRATNQTKLTLKAYILSAFIVVPASYIFISKFGIWGAITTALLGAFLPKMIIIYMELKIIGCKFSEYFPWKNMIKIISISIISLLPMILLSDYFTKNAFTITFWITLYLAIVVFFEIRFEVFIVDRQYIERKITFIKNKLVNY